MSASTTTRYRWAITNARTGVTTYYQSNTGSPVTAEHALTSPSVTAWLAGDIGVAGVPEDDATHTPPKQETSMNWDVVNMITDSVITVRLGRPVIASQVLKSKDVVLWAEGHLLKVRPTRYSDMPAIRVTSSDGILMVNRRTGMVVSTNILVNDSYLEDVVWVDLDDFFTAFPHRDRATIDDIDILHLAYASDHGEGIKICESCFNFRAEKGDYDPSYFKA